MLKSDRPLDLPVFERVFQVWTLHCQDVRTSLPQHKHPESWESTTHENSQTEGFDFNIGAAETGLGEALLSLVSATPCLQQLMPHTPRVPPGPVLLGQHRARARRRAGGQRPALMLLSLTVLCRRRRRRRLVARSRTGRAGELGKSITFWNPDYDKECAPVRQHRAKPKPKPKPP